MTLTDKSLFLLRRAEEEAILAIVSDRAAAAAVHDALALRYSERAIEALAEEGDGIGGQGVAEPVITLRC